MVAGLVSVLVVVFLPPFGGAADRVLAMVVCCGGVLLCLGVLGYSLVF